MALLFSEVVSRFRFLEIKLVTPYSDGSGYFIGHDRAKAMFPYATGPISHVANYRPNQVIPAPVVKNWMMDLDLTPEEIATFWALGEQGSGERQLRIDLSKFDSDK